MRAFDRDLIRGEHYGQRPSVPRSKAEHMAAPTNAAGVKKALANPEPSTHGPLATKCRRVGTSALGSQADQGSATSEPPLCEHRLKRIARGRGRRTSSLSRHRER